MFSLSMLNAISYLQPGDVVDVIAPASRCDENILPRIEPFFANWNLKSRVPYDLFASHPFSSNQDEIRFQHLKQALLDPTSKAIWCLRGGYGSARLIPFLNQMAPLPPKIFIGFSDITALHLFLYQKWGWKTIHGPSVSQAVTQTVSAESLTILKNMLFGKQKEFIFSNVMALNNAAKKQGNITGKLMGGNLSLIQTSLGTDWQIHAKDHILLIEEVNERGYRIDRMLEQLKQADIFHSVKAILFGDILGGNELDGKSLAQQAIDFFAQSCDVPVLQISGVGHGTMHFPLILGEEVRLYHRQKETQQHPSKNM